jgi:hypothetical protein
MNDIDVVALADLFAPLEPFPEAVKRLDRWGAGRYYSQKAHCIGWLLSQPTTGSGAYTRREPNHSGRVCYNRILNPGMLIWMAAVLGADYGTIERATAAAIRAEAVDYRGRCNAFRSVISFDDLLRLMADPVRWKCDRRLKTGGRLMAPVTGKRK